MSRGQERLILAGSQSRGAGRSDTSYTRPILVWPDMPNRIGPSNRVSAHGAGTYMVPYCEEISDFDPAIKATKYPAEHVVFSTISFDFTLHACLHTAQTEPRRALIIQGV